MSDARYQTGDSLLTLFCQRVEVKGRYRVLTGAEREGERRVLTSWVYDVFPVDSTGVRFPNLEFWGVPEFQLIAMDEYDSEVASRSMVSGQC